MKVAFGVVLALASSGCFALGYLGQHRSVTAIGPISLRRSIAAARALLGSPEWVVGYASSWVGWGLYIGALALAPLSVVQAVSAGTIGVLVVSSRGAISARRRRGRRGALVAGGGLVLVVASAGAADHGARPGTAATAVFVAVVVALGVVGLVSLRSRSLGAALGLLSGVLYGAGDVATKAAVGGKVWFVPVFLTCAAAGFVVLQLSYRHASLLATAGLSNLLTNLTPIVAGLVLFGESPTRPVFGWIRATGLVLCLLGGSALASERVDVADDAVRS